MSINTSFHRYTSITRQPTDNYPRYYMIEYKAMKDEAKSSHAAPLTVKSVIFERWNNDAGITEEIMVPWQLAFQWADHDPCGGLGLKAVIMSDGSRGFASGLYFNGGNPGNKRLGIAGGLSAVVVGCSGSTWLQRLPQPEEENDRLMKCLGTTERLTAAVERNRAARDF